MSTTPNLDAVRRTLADSIADLDATIHRLTNRRGELVGALARIEGLTAGVTETLTAAQAPAPVTEVRDPAAARILRVGDVVAVKPSRPGKRDGWIGEIRRITPGEVPIVEVSWPGGSPRSVALARLGVRKSKAATR